MPKVAIIFYKVDKLDVKLAVFNAFNAKYC